MALVIPDSPHIDVAHERINEIMESGRSRYRTDIPFHPYAHAEITTSLWLADFVVCRENGIGEDELDLEVGVATTALHDTDYHERFIKDQPYSSKEQRSMSIARIILPGLGFPDFKVEWAAQGIRPTEAGEPCESLFDVSVVRADVNNVQGPYPKFLNLFVANVNELAILGVTERGSFQDAKMRGVEKLHQYFDQDLSYPFEKDRHYNEAGLENIDRLEAETQESVEDQIGMPFYGLLDKTS